MDLKGLGAGAQKFARSGPIVISGSGALTFQGSVQIPKGMVGEWLILKVKANAGTGSGTGTAEVAELISRLIAQVEGNRVQFERGTLNDAALVSGLMVMPFPATVTASDFATDPTMAAAATDYQGYWKIAQGLPSGIVQFRLDTVALASAFTGLTLTGTPTITVEFIIGLQDVQLDDNMSEFYCVSGEYATSITSFEIKDANAIVLVHASASMAAYGVTATDGNPKASADLSSDEDLHSTRFSGSGYAMPVIFDQKVDVRITNSSAVSFTAIVIRDAVYSQGLSAAVQEKLMKKAYAAEHALKYRRK